MPRPKPLLDRKERSDPQININIQKNDDDNHINITSRKINYENAVYLYASGKSMNEIAKIYGVDPSAISRVIKLHNTKIAQIQGFKKERLNLILKTQMMILDSITIDEISKVSFRDKITAFGILFDKEILERRSEQGDSPLNFVLNLVHNTNNVSVTAIRDSKSKNNNGNNNNVTDDIHHIMTDNQDKMDNIDNSVTINS